MQKNNKTKKAVINADRRVFVDNIGENWIDYSLKLRFPMTQVLEQPLNPDDNFYQLNDVRVVSARKTLWSEQRPAGEGLIIAAGHQKDANECVEKEFADVALTKKTLKSSRDTKSFFRDIFSI